MHVPAGERQVPPQLPFGGDVSAYSRCRRQRALRDAGCDEHFGAATDSKTTYAGEPSSAALHSRCRSA